MLFRRAGKPLRLKSKETFGFSLKAFLASWRMQDFRERGNWPLNMDQGVLREQLAATLSNNAECKIEVFRSLSTLLLSRPAPSRTFSVTRESGWRGGGYNPGAWCNDLVSILRGEHPQGQFQVTASSERSESPWCAPFNCPQYNYSCTVQVTTQGEN